MIVVVTMLMGMMMMIYNDDDDNDLACNDLATWIGEDELPGGRHLVKDVDDDNCDNDDNNDDSCDNNDDDDNDDHNYDNADNRKTDLRTLSALVILVWNEAGHPSTLVNNQWLLALVGGWYLYNDQIYWYPSALVGDSLDYNTSTLGSEQISGVQSYFVVCT